MQGWGGAVASLSGGTLEVEDNTIVNTESTAVRTVARPWARRVPVEVAMVTRVVLAEKRVRIGADRQRRAERAALC